MLDSNEITQLNGFENFLRFKYNEPFKKFLSLKEKFILLISGNQMGKTSGASYNYVLRILGNHPIPEKNVNYWECENKHTFAPYKLPENKICDCGKELKRHERVNKIFRFCAETLPGQSENVGKEVKNTQYPEFKKWCPSFLIKKDITIRNPALLISDPYGGEDIVIEFISYNQSTQSTAGVQRLGIWMDEAPNQDFYEEQLPRLIAEDGDLVITYTPVDRSSWIFDELYDKSKYIYRSDNILEYLKTRGIPSIKEEKSNSPYSIATIMAATDDNPTLKKEVIESMFNHIDDPDAMAIRRYGLFKQLSGRIFKDFDYSIHFIEKNKYFPDGIPLDWIHARGIDYHPQTPWAVGIMSISPQNEIFIWGEAQLSPDKYVTKEMCKIISDISKNYKFRFSLIDPLAGATKKDRITVKDDINREFDDLKKHGIGYGGNWSSWDTKGEKGRDAIRERLKNSRKCGKPFNNKVVIEGITKYLPTIWILDNCAISGKCMKNWRWAEWGESNSSKDEKNMPEQKWSHMNMVYECILKEPYFRSTSNIPYKKNETSIYFRGNYASL